MLRHYDEIDLLKPIYIDSTTNYRYYNEEQLLIVARIHSLKNMGFGLSVIKEILKCYDDKKELERYLRIRHTELMAISEETAQRIRFLETAMEKLRRDDIMNYDVVLKTLPKRQVASVRQIIPRYEEEGRLWHVLFKETRPLNLVLGEPAYFSALLHDKEYKECDVDVEVQITVKGNYSDTEHVQFKEIPEITAASIVFQGPYEQFREVYAALAIWVEANGYEYCGPMFDIYHVSPHETQNPEEYITEVCSPIRKKERK